MREIKFRAWHKEESYMTNSLELIDFADGYIIAYGNLDKFELMQYTGIKDKNNKEIYEGDIVKALIDGEYYNQEVDWIEDMELIGWNLKVDREYEVIGNIYENPELLKEQ